MRETQKEIKLLNPVFLTSLKTKVDLERLNFPPLTFMKPVLAVMFLKCQQFPARIFQVHLIAHFITGTIR